MNIQKDIIKLHDDLVEYASKIQSTSASKFKSEKHIPQHVYTAFCRINAFGIILHRAVKTLCEEGWTQVSPLLLRTIMECSANCLAIIRNDFPEYMAFRYLYFEYVSRFRDKNTPASLKEKAKIDIAKGLESIEDSTAKEKAERFVSRDKLKTFWFQQKKETVSKIIELYGSAELRENYGFLSMSVHAGHFGMFLFKDDPDDIDINPCENPRNTIAAILYSSRMLLELLMIRNTYEELGLDSEYERLYERIMSHRNDS